MVRRGKKFFRNWGQGEVTAGTYNKAGVPNFPGEIVITKYLFTISSGPFTVAGSTAAYPTAGAAGAGYAQLQFDPSIVSDVYGGAQTVMPSSINQPVCLYLGRTAQV